MKIPIDHLRQRAKDNWLIGYHSLDFLSSTENLYQEFSNYSSKRILIVEPDPIRFLSSFIAACSGNHHVFLGNPTWGSCEWQQVFDLVKPDIVWGNCEYTQQYHISSHEFIEKEPVSVQVIASPQTFHHQNLPENQRNSLIMIPTGGSSGKIRFAMHTWQTLMASVEGFREYFLLNKVNSICVLPLYHVSGLMQFMRSFTSGGQLLTVPFKELKTGKWCNFDSTEFFLSLVPTQLQCLLSDSNLTTWLSQCKTVLLGGAPAWSEIFEKARLSKIKLAPSYGMTETASQIATLKPESFLAGQNSSFQVLPHVKVSICNGEEKVLDSQQIGHISIESPSLALGYYPEAFSQSDIFYPDDIGFFDEQQNLTIVGRSSDKIITGGENVFPCEVEGAIRATDLVKDVSVIGIPDSYWGQMIAAVYIPREPSIPSEQIRQAVDGKLSRFKIPKLWLPINKLPRNEQGKINRIKIQELVNNHK